jgi:hypothetical protein
MKKMLVASLAVALCATAASATDLSLTVDRTDSNTSFPMTVTFDVVATLSDALNEGLAAYGFDLRGEKDGVAFDVTGATVTVPAGIEAFSLYGLTNPAGYGGTPINGVLVQIGAAQNTIANPGPNPPFPIGTVRYNVGDPSDPDAPWIVAQVSITLTDAPTTDYTFYVENGFANVIREGEFAAPQMVDKVDNVTGDMLVVVSAPSCVWDIDGNGVVNPIDSGICMSKFGCTVGGGDAQCDACDIDGNTVVNPIDSGVIMSNFGDCP